MLGDQAEASPLKKRVQLVYGDSLSVHALEEDVQRHSGTCQPRLPADSMPSWHGARSAGADASGTSLCGVTWRRCPTSPEQAASSRPAQECPTRGILIRVAAQQRRLGTLQYQPLAPRRLRHKLALLQAVAQQHGEGGHGHERNLGAGGWGRG